MIISFLFRKSKKEKAFGLPKNRTNEVSTKIAGDELDDEEGFGGDNKGRL